MSSNGLSQRKRVKVQGSGNAAESYLRAIALGPELPEDCSELIIEFQVDVLEVYGLSPRLAEQATERICDQHFLKQFWRAFFCQDHFIHYLSELDRRSIQDYAEGLLTVSEFMGIRASVLLFQSWSSGVSPRVARSFAFEVLQRDGFSRPGHN